MCAVAHGAHCATEPALRDDDGAADDGDGRQTCCAMWWMRAREGGDGACGRARAMG